MSKRYNRQSFLGPRAPAILDAAKIGIVGLNGGGSHFVQLLPHLGFRRFVVYDPDCVDRDGTNLNRNVLAVADDARVQSPKTELARRKLSSLHDGRLELETHTCRWQERPDPLKSCDIIFGAVDSFAQRRELEVCARRYMVPYIDVGLDVHTVDGQPPRMAGQIILSMPGGPCMHCLGFLTPERLALEAGRYGQAGERAQVVWANGVLAALAVGVAVDLLTDWTKSVRGPVYLSYDANTGTVQPHVKLAYAPELCIHYPRSAVGEPRLLAV